MFILKAYRNSATFEQHFYTEDEYYAKLEVLKDNGWTIGSHAHTLSLAAGWHILDHSLALILLRTCAYAFLSIYHEYFRNGNKISSDEDLMQRYIFLTMKQHAPTRFPKMEIK